MSGRKKTTVAFCRNIHFYLYLKHNFYINITIFMNEAGNFQLTDYKKSLDEMFSMKYYYNCVTDKNIKRGELHWKIF